MRLSPAQRVLRRLCQAHVHWNRFMVASDRRYEFTLWLNEHKTDGAVRRWKWWQQRCERLGVNTLTGEVEPGRILDTIWER